jgi:GTP-binding protein HflX
VRNHRLRHRQQRTRAGLPVVALVGYTNAGKSTLLNTLSGSDVYVADQLFATLDPTTRRVELPSGRVILLSDTVGFIQKLPVTLVAAFRATLEEIADADLLLHVVDVSHPRAIDHIDVVEDTLAELDATRLPKLLVLNKIDLGDHSAEIDHAAWGYRDVVRTSATQGRGLDDLLAAVGEALVENMVDISVLVPYAQGELLSLIHSQGIVLEETYTASGVEMKARVSPQVAGQLDSVLGQK